MSKEEFKQKLLTKLESHHELHEETSKEIMDIRDKLDIIHKILTEVQALAILTNDTVIDKVNEHMKKIDHLNVTQAKSAEKPKTATRSKKTTAAAAKPAEVNIDKMPINNFAIYLYVEEEKEFNELVPQQVINEAFASKKGQEVIAKIKNANPDDEAVKKKKAKVIYDFLRDTKSPLLDEMRALKKRMAGGSSPSETASVASRASKTKAKPKASPAVAVDAESFTVSDNETGDDEE